MKRIDKEKQGYKRKINERIWLISLLWLKYAKHDSCKTEKFWFSSTILLLRINYMLELNVSQTVDSKRDCHRKCDLILLRYNKKKPNYVDKNQSPAERTKVFTATHIYNFADLNFVCRFFNEYVNVIFFRSFNVYSCIWPLRIPYQFFLFLLFFFFSFFSWSFSFLSLLCFLLL